MGKSLMEARLLVLLAGSIVGHPSWHLCISHQVADCPGGCLSFLIHLHQARYTSTCRTCWLIGSKGGDQGVAGATPGAGVLSWSVIVTSCCISHDAKMALLTWCTKLLIKWYEGYGVRASHVTKAAALTAYGSMNCTYKFRVCLGFKP